jgi:PAS domain S-box-containing protein
MTPLSLGVDHLPVAALATRDGVSVDVNAKFEELTGWRRDEVLGCRVPDLLAKLVAPRDRAIFERLAKNRESAEPRREGSLWCRVVSASGEERPMRVEWRLHENGRDSVTLLVDARPEAYGQQVTETLARAAGALSRCGSEEEILQHAVDALAERGFTSTVLLWDADDPLLRYGPTGRPAGGRGAPDLPRPPREILAKLNPGFFQRRAAFFQDGVRLVREAYPEAVAERLLALLPAERMVQAPIFLGEEPYGALVVTSDALSPLVATALDLFAELVGKAIESSRLRQERVTRERMAALGEAAAVMAHEVRNPVGSIMNALALIERQKDGDTGPLLTIISEESKRLAQLVTQLLELGRPLHPRPCAIAMEELIDRAVRLVITRGGVFGRAIELPSTRDTTVWLDPTLAELAIVNVIQNALQSTSPGGRVRVSVEACNLHVQCVVVDDGPGIPDEVRKRIGQPFVTTRATGTGMGLAVVRRIMEVSEGRMLVEDHEPVGTRVRLEFPRPVSERT